MAPNRARKNVSQSAQRELSNASFPAEKRVAKRAERAFQREFSRGKTCRKARRESFPTRVFPRKNVSQSAQRELSNASFPAEKRVAKRAERAFQREFSRGKPCRKARRESFPTRVFPRKNVSQSAQRELSNASFPAENRVAKRAERASQREFSRSIWRHIEGDINVFVRPVFQWNQNFQKSLRVGEVTCYIDSVRRGCHNWLDVADLRNELVAGNSAPPRAPSKQQFNVLIFINTIQNCQYNTVYCQPINTLYWSCIDNHLGSQIYWVPRQLDANIRNTWKDYLDELDLRWLIFELTHLSSFFMLFHVFSVFHQYTVLIMQSINHCLSPPVNCLRLF